MISSRLDGQRRDIRPLMPRMPRMLNRLEPMTLPMAMSPRPRTLDDERSDHLRQPRAGRDDRQADHAAPTAPATAPVPTRAGDGRLAPAGQQRDSRDTSAMQTQRRGRWSSDAASVPSTSAFESFVPPRVTCSRTRRTRYAVKAT